MVRVLIILIILFLVFSGVGEGDVVEVVSKQVSVNWTKSKVVIQSDMETQDYLVGKDFMDEIRFYKERLKGKIIYELIREMNSIVFDENRQVFDIFQVFPEKETRLISILMRSEFKNFWYYGKRVFGMFEFPIFGMDGLFDVVKLPTIRQSYSKFIGYSEPKVYTGLLINVNKLNFKISLSPVVCLENGEVVYSYGSVIGSKLHIYYFESLGQAISSGVFGDRVYYLFPKDIVGRNKTRIIISDDDAYRILSTEENFGIFEDGRVGIVFKE